MVRALRPVRWAKPLPAGKRWRPRLFCGPTAIAATLHVSAEEALRLADGAREGRRGGGMTGWELQDAITDGGGQLIEVKVDKAPAIYRGDGELFEDRLGRLRTKRYYKPAGEPLGKFLRRTARTGKTYIIVTPGHYIVAEGLLVLDTRYKRPTWVYDTTYPRRRVIRAFEVRRAA